jgi:hypothetical protein
MKTFTLFHVLISLVGILSGFAVVLDFLARKRLEGWTRLFLASTAATSVTGFFFPFRGLTPAMVVGIVSLLVLTIAIFARYARHLYAAWRKTYVMSAMLALYLNVFVLVVQPFLHVPALKAIAPTQNDPPFRLAQLSVLLTFVIAGAFAVIRFRTGSPPLASQTTSQTMI